MLRPADATGAGDPPRIAGLILKVAGACNLNCGYCYVYNAQDQTWRDRPGLMGRQTLERTLERARDYCVARPGHRMTLCLHGGEPLLMGKRRLAEAVALIRERMGPHLGALVIQTNGVLIDREWAKLLKALRLNVSLSLDGGQAAHDAARPDHKGRGSWAAAVRGFHRLAEAGVHASVLCVVNPGHSGVDAYRELRGLGATSIDFLLPDVSHDQLAERFGAFGPTPVADVLIPALDAWLAENDPAVEIRLFSDMVRLALGADCSTDAFGGGSSPYLVIETDGSIQTNDALRVCEEGMPETGLDVAEHSFEDLPRGKPAALAVIAGAIAPASACRGCPEETTCGGGYMPHRYSRARSFDNPSVWCADIRALFARVREVLAEDAARPAA